MRSSRWINQCWSHSALTQLFTETSLSRTLDHKEVASNWMAPPMKTELRVPSCAQTSPNHRKYIDKTTAPWGETFLSSPLLIYITEAMRTLSLSSHSWLKGSNPSRAHRDWKLDTLTSSASPLKNTTPSNGGGRDSAMFQQARCFRPTAPSPPCSSLPKKVMGAKITFLSANVRWRNFHDSSAVVLACKGL